MKSVSYRGASAPSDIRFAVAACSLGSVLVARSERGVCAILLGDEAHELQRDLRRRFPGANLIGDASGLGELTQRVIDLVEYPAGPFEPPLDIRGSGFQRRVWHALRQIPAGATASYAEIAARIRAPKAARAVAQACSANPLAIAVPCHRVVRSDGALSGYRWGMARKQTLLSREAGA